MSVYEMEFESQGFSGESGEYEGEGFLGEYEGEGEGFLGESEYEGEGFLGGVLGSLLGGEIGEMHAESPLSESQEMELAAELLEVNSEAELEQFLGKLISGVAKGVGGFMKSSTGRALGGILKNVAKKALPVVGGALGSLVAPGVGTAVGSKLGSLASGLFEMELEGLGEQEAEFEVARRVVRLAGTAARNAATAPPTAPGGTVARAAVITAARRHAPGLLRGTPYQQRRSGGPRPAGGFRSRRSGGSFPGGDYRRRRPGRRPGWVGGPWVGPGYGAGGFEPASGDGYGGDGDGSGGNGYGGNGSGRNGSGGNGYGDGMSGYGSGERLPIPSAGRWIRRGRKIVLLGL